MIRQRDYPRDVKVGDSLYGVRFVRVFPSPAPKLKKPLFGYCCYVSQTLYIAAGLDPKERLSTFIHELMHALDDEHGIGLTHDQIYKLESSLLKLLIDNDFLP